MFSMTVVGATLRLFNTTVNHTGIGLKKKWYRTFLAKTVNHKLMIPKYVNII